MVKFRSGTFQNLIGILLTARHKPAHRLLNQVFWTEDACKRKYMAMRYLAQQLHKQSKYPELGLKNDVSKYRSTVCYEPPTDWREFALVKLDT